MKISVDEAREYWSHHTQQEKSFIHPDDLPDDEAFQYWAQGGVCGAFHLAPWPNVWMAHYAVKPEVWGKAAGPAKAILGAFWAEEQPELIIGWTDETNRAALAFARRIGFKENGRMNLPSGAVVMQEYTEWV